MKWWLGSFAIGALLLAAAWRIAGGDLAIAHRLVSPGMLSSGHAFLAADCAACHTARTGPEPAKCIGCHANNQVLLQRQATAFHAGIGACAACHKEHNGESVPRPVMNHLVLATLGEQATAPAANSTWRNRLVDWLRRVHEPDRSTEHDATNPLLSRTEAGLNCASCHILRDRHQLLFGPECGACHRTDRWTIPGYLHPSERSTECVQCHQAPPSHYMMHFQMVSQVVAKQPRATVEQCYACHLTTRWNDIRGVGWYKHH